uniref:Digalactosyldiacylglycerol synthase 2, chloroplastic n=1 Tax=Arundo donax TaxID=35708 RepID=A0A0A9F845_ARUDO
MELYGSGEDADEVKASAERLNLDISLYPGRDHGDSIFHDYKVFINPSTTDVVCTTTAEALAMGKIVICANHPSNEFFKRFPNCHMYSTEKEFVRLTMKALGEEPIPLSDELWHELSWEAATERFVGVADIAPAMSVRQQPPSSQHFMHISPHDLKKNMEEASAFFHNTISGIEAARYVFGGIPNTLQPDEQQCKELGWNLRG